MRRKNRNQIVGDQRTGISVKFRDLFHVVESKTLIIYPNLAVSGFIIANCIRRRVTSRGYENDWATAPANPPHNNFEGTFNTRPPVLLEFSLQVYVGEYFMHKNLNISKQ